MTTVEMFNQMTDQEKIDNMFLMGEVEISTTEEELDSIGLDERYNGLTGRVTHFNKDDLVVELNSGETVKVYRGMLQGC